MSILCLAIFCLLLGIVTATLALATSLDLIYINLITIPPGFVAGVWAARLSARLR